MVTRLVKFYRAALSVITSWFRYRELLSALLKRDIAARYRGSAFGILWSLITPLVLLATYTLVFSYFFAMRWNAEEHSRFYFVVMLFCGIIPYNFFNEVLTKCPELILKSPNYVKRIAFPVQLLPTVVTGSTLFHAVISHVLLLILIVLVQGGLPITALYLPLIWLPFILFALSISLLVSAAGVFMRDLSHGVGLLGNILFFLTPIIYPAAFISEKAGWLLWLNPIAVAVVQIRETCVLGQHLNYPMWGWLMAGNIGLLFFSAGWFKLVSKRFADVI